MKLVLLICNQESALGSIKDFIPDTYSVLEGEMGPKGLQLLRSIVSGVVVVDIGTPGVLPWMEEAYRWRPDLTYLGVAADPSLSHSMSKYFYDFLHLPFTSWQVRSLLDRSWERVELVFELQSLKKKTEKKAEPPGCSVPPGGVPSPSTPLKERVLCDLSRVLTNNLNQDKLLELFLDAVAELVPVGKLSILLLNERYGHYLVSAQRGLDPDFCSGLVFKPSRGLISWLIAEGRMFRAEEIPGPNGAVSGEALQEMQLLQAVVSIPLSVHGQLMGALNLGPKITGAPFYEEELETLYILSANTGMALRDIQLHHQLRYQKLFIENILQRMNSGVVAINGNDNVVTFNARAGEILGLRPEKIVGKDLRHLPSPLGDLLYGALATGQACDKEEIELARGRVPLEVSTYQLVNGERVLGSVMIFDDISARKKLEQEKCRADQLDVLNRFVGQLAHEVKNPMVAIQTFSELLPEKYHDSSFRDFFTQTVRQEVKRLNELVEQLIAFSTPLTYKYTVAEVHELLDMGLSLLREQGKGAKTTVDTSYFGERLHIRADKTLLARAFSYLLNYFQSMEVEGTLHVQTAYDQALFGCGGVSIGFWDSKTKVGSEEVKRVFDPLCARQDSYISLKLPVSRKIIEDHGGRVEAVLTKDKRLKFEVCLPIFSDKGGEGVGGTR